MVSMSLCCEFAEGLPLRCQPLFSKISWWQLLSPTDTMPQRRPVERGKERGLRFEGPRSETFRCHVRHHHPGASWRGHLAAPGCQPRRHGRWAANELRAAQRGDGCNSFPRSNGTFQGSLLVPFGISPARYPADAACIGGASGHAWDHSTGGVDGSGETQRGGAASAAAVAPLRRCLLFQRLHPRPRCRSPGGTW